MSVQAELEEELAWVRAYTGGVILFGAKYCGSIIQKACRGLQKQVLCYCDNDVGKHHSTINGLPVFSPQEAYEKYPDALVIVCTFQADNTASIQVQLRRLGFAHVLSKDALMYHFLLQSRARELSAQQAVGLLELMRAPKGFVMRDITLLITTKCTLRCKNCCAFIPCYTQPDFLPADQIIRDAGALLCGIDGLLTINPMGGETLLHPQIVEICRGLAKIKNILNIRLTTNGTIVPDIDYEALAQCGVSVQISDYGEFSDKKQELTAMLDQYGIPNCFAEEIKAWYEMPEPHKQNKSKQALVEQYQACYFRRQSTQAVNGRYYGCSIAASLSLLLNYPGHEKDSIPLMPVRPLEAEITALDTAVDCLVACDYCCFNQNKIVTNYEQAPRTTCG